MAEPHIESTIDEGSLALDCYSFIKGNHPRNVRKSSVGRYAKDSLSSKARFDFAIQPECIVYDSHLNKKSTFSPLFIEVPAKMTLNLITS